LYWCPFFLGWCPFWRSFRPAWLSGNPCFPFLSDVTVRQIFVWILDDSDPIRTTSNTSYQVFTVITTAEESNMIRAANFWHVGWYAWQKWWVLVQMIEFISSLVTGSLNPI
jgi:hypothetical protein